MIEFFGKEIDMKTGLTARTFCDRLPEEIISAASEASLACIEWDEAQIQVGDEALAEAIGNQTRKAGLSVSSYSTEFQVGVYDALTFDAICRTAKALGTTVVGVCLPSLDTVQDSLIIAEARKHLATAKAQGLSLALQYRVGTLTEDCTRALDFLRAVDDDGLKLVFEPNPQRSKEYNMEALASYLPHLHAVHVRSIRQYPLHREYALWEEVLASLLGAGIECPLLIDGIPVGNQTSLKDEATTLCRLLDEACPLPFEDLLEEAVVYLAEEHYQIVFCTKEAGAAWVRIGQVTYYDQDNGCIYHDRKVHKLKVPTALLDRECRYTVGFRRVNERNPYDFKLARKQEKSYRFTPPRESMDMRLAMIGDVHGAYDVAARMGRAAGQIDLLVLNGDIADSNQTEEDLLAPIRVASRVTGGECATVFARGNHDTRGHCAPHLSDYVATDEGKTYFTFRAGNMFGIVLDFGEDKTDDHPSYGTLADYESFRRRQIAFLDRILEEGIYEEYEYVVAICHIGPEAQADRYISSEWMARLAAICPDVMLVAHRHSCYVTPPCFEEKADYPPVPFPVVTGACPKHTEDAQAARFVGTVAEFSENGIVINFLDNYGASEGTYHFERRPDGGEIF